MEHVYKKTGLGLAISQAIEDLKLEHDRRNIEAMMISTFQKKMHAFIQCHKPHAIPSVLVRGEYLVENEYPLGQNDAFQYFRTIGHKLYMYGNIPLTIEENGEQKKWTVIEGFSPNINPRKNHSANKAHSPRTVRSTDRREKSSDAKTIQEHLRKKRMQK